MGFKSKKWRLNWLFVCLSFDIQITFCCSFNPCPELSSFEFQIACLVRQTDYKGFYFMLCGIVRGLRKIIFHDFWQPLPVFVMLFHEILYKTTCFVMKLLSPPPHFYVTWFPDAHQSRISLGACWSVIIPANPKEFLPYCTMENYPLYSRWINKIYL